MPYVALAALSGLVWGIGDFAGGKATQRASALPVTWLSKVASLPLLGLYLILGRAPLQPASLIWGALGGLAGVIGIIVFYRALSAGAMTVVAPITAVTSAAIPVAVGLARGEPTTGLRLLAIGCALAAIALVSLSAHHQGQPARVGPRLVAAAVAAGVAFALFFVFLSTASRVVGGTPGLWPIAASQFSALCVVSVLLAVRRPALPRGKALRWTLLAGPLDMSANALYLLATRTGDLSVVAPLAALYPVTTVLLALVIDRERLRPVQVAGLGLAVAALVLLNR